MDDAAPIPPMSSKEFFLQINTQISASVRSEIASFVESFQQTQKDIRSDLDATRAQVTNIAEESSKQLLDLML